MKAGRTMQGDMLCGCMKDRTLGKLSCKKVSGLVNLSEGIFQIPSGCVLSGHCFVDDK